MITLKTLPKATKQEIFDQVAKHMLTQMQKSIRKKGSRTYGAYRGLNGLKCAAGCLIADEEYNPEFEKYTWNSLADWEYVPDSEYVLIQRLQDIHEEKNPKNWKKCLKNLCDYYFLEWKF